MVVFFSMFFGVNLTFFPLHFAGIHGYPRKYVDYPDVYSVWNIVASFGRMLRVFSLLLFVYLLFDSFYTFRLFVSEDFMNNGPEGVMGVYVFGHSYLGDMFFRVKWGFIILNMFDCRSGEGCPW